MANTLHILWPRLVWGESLIMEWLESQPGYRPKHHSFSPLDELHFFCSFWLHPITDSASPGRPSQAGLPSHGQHGEGRWYNPCDALLPFTNCCPLPLSPKLHGPAIGNSVLPAASSATAQPCGAAHRVICSGAKSRAKQPYPTVALIPPEQRLSRRTFVTSHHLALCW